MKDSASLYRPINDVYDVQCEQVNNYICIVIVKCIVL